MQLQKFVLATLFLGLSATAIAEPDGKGKHRFDRFDLNGDGYLSFEEFTPPGHEPEHKPGHKPGHRADLDENGEITREEMTTHIAERNLEISERANRRFDQMDADGDGVVTSQEAKEAAFYRLDKDQDGFLSAAELKHPHKRHNRKRAS
jgi:Ca2+-binding EF-hand superfamily protein